MKDALTIKEAIDQYKDHGHEIYGTAMREALNAFAKERSNNPLSNDSYADALFLTDIMFNRIFSSMSVLTGPCVENFLNALREPFIKALRRIKNVGTGNARFILLDREGPTPKILMDLKDQGLPVEWRYGRSADGAKVCHFIVADGKLLRDEKYHTALKDDDPATKIQANVFFNSPAYAESKQIMFDSIWNDLPACPA